jgi:hypothetical protein
MLSIFNERVKIEKYIIFIIIILIFYILINGYFLIIEPFDNTSYIKSNLNNEIENIKTIQQYNLKRDVISLDSNKIQSIEDPISEKYLTFRNNDINTESINTYDFNIIQAFKQILNRQPNSDEIMLYKIKLSTGEINISFLYMILYNTTEYENIMMLQLNDIDRGLENAIFKNKLYDLIKKLYNRYVKTKINNNILSPLRDVYIHLHFDIYLFISFLNLKNYKPFEKEVLNTPVLNKYILKEIFDKYIDLSLLLQFANSLKEIDLKDGKSSILNETFDMKSINNNEILLQETDTNMKDTTTKILDYINSSHISEAVDTKNYINNGPYCRYYNPSAPNKSEYKSNINKPPICTSLNQPQLVQPLFINDSMNFQGTNLNMDTSIGSIMPKFEFNEYI